MTTNEELISAPYTIHVEYEMYYGRISRFFKELRDNKKIMGTKCPKCGITYCPPSSDCPKCWVPNEWVEIGPQGILQAYTIVGIASLWIKVDVPYVLGLIKLDGADTGLMHFIGEVDVDKVKNGMRVEPVFKEEREGYITDIAYFKPVS